MLEHTAGGMSAAAGLADQPAAAAAHRHLDPSKRVRPGAAAPAPELGRGSIVVTSLVAGACAGALAKTAIAPLDRTKINFQTSHTPYTWRGALAYLAGTARAEGAAALWRGNSATLARIVPYAAIQFTAHEQLKRVLRVDSPAAARQHPVRHLAAGSVAGVVSQSATYPLDMVRARMAVYNTQEYATLRKVITRVVQDEGFLTLYRGYAATMLGVIPYAGISFFTYDSLKHKYLEYFGSPQGAGANLAFGGAAGALAQTATYPLDVARRRMQTARRRADGSYPYSTVPRAVRELYSAEGVRGFFKGLSMNWVKGPIAVSISFASYDAIRTTLRDVAVTLQS